MERKGINAGTAIYIAGVMFSFGIRLGRLPLPPVDAPESAYLYFFLWALAEFVLSLATSWLGAGLAIGDP